MVTFVAGGMMGDFIHSLYVVKNICEQKGEKANLFITNGHGGDVWRFDMSKTHQDVCELIFKQPYINRFEVLDLNNIPPDFINLNDWRRTLIHTAAGYVKCWSEVLTECYNFPIPKEYKWLDVDPYPATVGKTLIHRSVHRINGAFPWQSVLDKVEGEILFLTSNMIEWDRFQFKSDRITPLFVPTVSEMAAAIGSCKMFIGNQSAPFAIASALNVPRLVELDADPARFYIDEIKYSDKISYFLDHNTKYNAPPSNLL